MNVLAYNDALGFTSNPSAFSECYWRGAWIWKDAAETIPRDCQRFFLAPGVAENWQTLAANIAQIPMGVRIGFRIIDFRSVPAGWESRTIRGFAYPDFNDSATRAKYRAMLIDFKARHPRITWVDIPFPYAPSNEPSITEDDCRELGGGDLARGKAMYFEAAKKVIDLYVEVFGRALVGNFVSSSWIAKELLPYQQAAGIRAYRDDSWMRFDSVGNGIEGENRATLFDARIATLDGRDSFDRAVVEQNGNGLTLRNGVIVDQGSGLPCPVYEAMMGPGGEFEQLEITDWGNMGLPKPAPVSAHPNATKRIDDWYVYIGAAPIPGPVDPDPVDPAPAPYQFPVTVLGGMLVKAVFGGDIPTIYFDYDTTEEVIPIPIVNGARWNPRVVILPQPTIPDKWTIRPAEPSGEDNEDSFHCAGRDSAVVTFAGYEPPDPDPTPEPPAPIQYVTREEFEAYWSELMARVIQLESGKVDRGEQEVTVRLS